MAAWADKSERFVEIPGKQTCNLILKICKYETFSGIVEIRWVSDDPDYYVPPIDLFDEQKNGLPDFYGKKDKTTTEQAFFTCNLCECDLKSVVTLRAHCKGTQHIRKALQKKAEWRRLNKREAKVEVKTEGFRTLFEWLDQGTSEAVVGLENITEYLSGREGDEPYYHCNLEHCRDEQGDAETMKNHMLTARHKQAWLEKKTGSFLKHQTEISQRIAEFTKDFRRDFRDMKVVEDREMWRKAKEGKIRIERIAEFRTKTEKFDKREESSYRRREEENRREYEERGELNQYDRRQDYKRERYQEYQRERSHKYDRERGDKHDRKRRYDEYSEDNRRDENELRRSKYDRDQSHGYQMERSRSPLGRDERGWRSNERIKSELREDEPVERVRSSPRREEVEEVSRSGNFQNWSTATVKVDTDPSIATTSSKIVNTNNIMERSVNEEVDRLHRKVASRVMNCLNKYYPGAEEFDPYNHKIRSPEEYSRLAKQFSHQLRRKIKESYEAYNSTLEGIPLTGDHEQFIRTEVESYFETVSRIR